MKKKAVASTASNPSAMPNTYSAQFFSQPIKSVCLQLGLSLNLAKMVDRDSSSRKNLASKLVRDVFTKEERKPPPT